MIRSFAIFCLSFISSLLVASQSSAAFKYVQKCENVLVQSRTPEVQVKLNESPATEGRVIPTSPTAGNRPSETLTSLKILEFNLENLFESPAALIKSANDLDGLARVIRSSNPDVLVAIEVQNENVLQNFSREYLRNEYRAVLIQGNDARGINVGFLIRRTLPLDFTVRTYKNLYSNNEPVYSRDLPTLIVKPKNSENVLFTLSGTHFKSQRDVEGDRGGIEKRTLQAEATQMIFSELTTEFRNKPSLLAGDINNVYSSREFESLRQAGFRDALDLFSQPGPNRYTHYYFENNRPQFSQLDAVIVNSSFYNSNFIQSARIVRHLDANGRTIPDPRTFRERELHPSDHLATEVIINLVGLN